MSKLGTLLAEVSFGDSHQFGASNVRIIKRKDLGMFGLHEASPQFQDNKLHDSIDLLVKGCDLVGYVGDELTRGGHQGRVPQIGQQINQAHQTLLKSLMDLKREVH